MLISAVLPMIYIYLLPQGQYGYSGHVIKLPQGVASFSNSLPRLTSKLEVIIVRKEGTDQSQRNFHVQRNVDGSALDQLSEDGNLAQLRVIAIDSPTMDSPTSTASTSTSSSAPITITSPDDAAILVLLTSPMIHIVPTFLSRLFLQPCGQ